MKRRQIETCVWDDEKIEKCTWFEVFVFVHLLLRREMTTFGVIVTTPEVIAGKINGTARKNPVTPELPKILPTHVTKALKSLARRRLILIENKLQWTIYFKNFLRYQTWTANVPKSWPDLLTTIPSKKIRAVVRQDCVKYCKARGYAVPKGL